MKLLLKRAEKALKTAHERRRKRRLQDVALVWSGDDHELSDVPEEARLVRDVYITNESIGGVTQTRMVQRVARNDDDHGDVYRGEQLVGRVTAEDGSLVTWDELDPPAAHSAAPS